MAADAVMPFGRPMIFRGCVRRNNVRDTIDRSEHNDILRRVEQGEVVRVTMQADIVRMDKDLALVVQSIDGIPGLADDVKQIKVWRASLEATPKELKANRYRLIIAVVSILGGLSTLILLGTWLMQLLDKS